jgi:hypothetical protein
MARRRSSACVALISIRFMMRSFSVQLGIGAESDCAQNLFTQPALGLEDRKAHVAGADA